MLIKALLQYCLTVFVLLYCVWALFDSGRWWTYLSVAVTFFAVSWTAAYALYDRLHREAVTEPEKKAVLITGCDTGFGFELTIKLDQYGKVNLYFKITYSRVLFIRL